MNTSRGLCLFDLDDTLLPIDSDHAWGEFVIRLGWVDERRFRGANDAFYAAYKEGRARHSRLHRVRDRACAREPRRVAAAHLRFMREVIVPALRPGRSRWCAPITRAATCGARDRDQRLRHRSDRARLRHRRSDRDSSRARRRRYDHGPHRRHAGSREGKVTRVEEWLLEGGRGWDDFERISVYTDSLNDLPLLERATDPVATNPSPALEAIARERGWRILNLFE